MLAFAGVKCSAVFGAGAAPIDLLFFEGLSCSESSSTDANSAFILLLGVSEFGDACLESGEGVADEESSCPRDGVDGLVMAMMDTSALSKIPNL